MAPWVYGVSGSEMKPAHNFQAHEERVIVECGRDHEYIMWKRGLGPVRGVTCMTVMAVTRPKWTTVQSDCV